MLGRLLRRVLCLAGAHHLSRWFHRRELLIVGYHGLAAEEDSPHDYWHLVALREFEAQLRYLTRHYEILPLDQAIEKLRSRSIRHPTAAITFDDGYRNNRTVGLAVLQRFRVPATVFLTTGLIGTRRTVWPVEVLLAFEHSEATSVDLQSLGLGSVHLTDAPRRLALARTVAERVKHMPSRERQTILAAVHRQLGGERQTDPGAFQMMSWQEASEMQGTGLVSFGGHTVHHQILSMLDDDTLESEIRDSIHAVEERLGTVTGTFAYPNGQPQDFDRRAVDALRRTGATAAVTTIEGLNGPETEPFSLRRINIGADTSWDQFRLLTSGLIPTIKRWWRRH